MPLQAMSERMDGLEERIERVERELKKNTVTTNATKDDTGQILELFRASKLGAAAVKWLATVGTGLLVAWAAWKGIR